MSQVRSTSEPGLIIHYVVPDDFLSFPVDGRHLDPGPHSVIVCLPPAQADLHPTVVDLAGVDKELVRPSVARPHAAQSGVNILLAIVVEIKEHDAVPLLDGPESVEHGNVDQAARASGALRFAQIHQIRQHEPAFRISCSQIEVVASIVVDVAVGKAHGDDRHVEKLAVSLEWPRRSLHQNRAMARMISAAAFVEYGPLRTG